MSFQIIEVDSEIVFKVTVATAPADSEDHCSLCDGYLASKVVFDLVDTREPLFVAEQLDITCMEQAVMSDVYKLVPKEEELL